VVPLSLCAPGGRAGCEQDALIGPPVAHDGRPAAIREGAATFPVNRCSADGLIEGHGRSVVLSDPDVKARARAPLLERLCRFGEETSCNALSLGGCLDM
jgi:hypothetical protein